MNPERWHRIDELLSAVLERESGERASFLEKQCEGDQALIAAQALEKEINALKAQNAELKARLDALDHR